MVDSRRPGFPAHLNESYSAARNVRNGVKSHLR